VAALERAVFHTYARLAIPIHDFQLVLVDVKVMTEAVADSLYEAGCDDGTPFSSQGIAAVGFSREAASLEEAVRSAMPT
jgi:hypothetical protein